MLFLLMRNGYGAHAHVCPHYLNFLSSDKHCKPLLYEKITFFNEFHKFISDNINVQHRQEVELIEAQWIIFHFFEIYLNLNLKGIYHIQELSIKFLYFSFKKTSLNFQMNVVFFFKPSFSRIVLHMHLIFHGGGGVVIEIYSIWLWTQSRNISNICKL